MSDQPITTLPPAEQETPLYEFAKKSPLNMTDEELDVYVAQARELRASATTRKAVIADGKPKAKQPTLDFTKFLGKK